VSRSTAAGRATLLAVGAALVAACARGPKFPPPPRDPSIPDPAALDSATTARGALLRVESRNRADVTIYATRGAVRTRLGMVSAASARDFAIPASFVNDPGGFRLVADPVGSRGTLTSEPIVVRAGQRVVWTLETTLSRSSIAVY
jgi:hypothetical protein